MCWQTPPRVLYQASDIMLEYDCAKEHYATAQGSLSVVAQIRFLDACLKDFEGDTTVTSALCDILGSHIHAFLSQFSTADDDSGEYPCTTDFQHHSQSNSASVTLWLPPNIDRHAPEVAATNLRQILDVEGIHCIEFWMTILVQCTKYLLLSRCGDSICPWFELCSARDRCWILLTVSTVVINL